MYRRTRSLHDALPITLFDVMSVAALSRLPVYRDTLDEVVGIVHIKDLLHDTRERKESGGFDLVDLVRRILVVAPSMRVLDLLLAMRLSRVHMALVVDEIGGLQIGRASSGERGCQ